MCRETAVLAVVGGVVRSLVRIPKGGWVVLIVVPSSGQPFSALLAFHGGCLCDGGMTEVCDGGCDGDGRRDVNLRSERDQGSQVELDICKWQAAVVCSFGEAQGYSVCSLQR